MANESVEKAKGILTGNTSEAAQLKAMEESETCPTCGNPMKAASLEENAFSEEQGGKHTVGGYLTKTNFPGFKMRRLKQGEKISGGY